ncbi:thioredoxin family protein [Kribbella sp. NPDC004536]|uniref:thioredoxin family protein n=1 Tax=Kribbella sp. NPDC004536 TaxID=3364106 RepID=UPI00368C5005
MSASTKRLGVGDRAPAVPQSQPGAVTVVVFTANGCPFARAWHDRIQAVAREYGDRGVQVLQLISNDATDHPEDAPEALAARVTAGDFAGPLLHDADQALAQAFGATATPEVFVMDHDGIVRYHGAPDSDHDDPSQNAAWLREALDELLAGRAVARPETSAAGCSIKWRVELRWWEGCPSHDQAEELLTRTLRELKRDEVHVVRREVRTRDEAKDLGFVGSPTFAVGGRDLFASDAQPALTCRLYESDGRSGPLPSPADLADRLRSALARPWDLPGWVDPRKGSA